MAWKFVLDPSQRGLRKLLRGYQELVLRYFWDERAVDVGSREVWLYVNEKLGPEKSISRAAIINFLKAMRDEGILESRKVSAKGGYRDVYTMKMDEREYLKYVIKTVYDSLMRDYPEETRDSLLEFLK